MYYYYPHYTYILFVTFRCDSSARDMYKVMFYLNEIPMDFPECSTGLCSWETVRSKFEDVVNRCDYCSGSGKTQIFLPTLFSAIFVLFLYKLFD